MASEEISYIAFISYRHAEVDTAVARDIQRGLERFHVPHALREEGAPARLAPVFRDKEELPVSAALGDDIAQALAHSGALVVVCSPRTKESAWVQREIDTFLQTHGRSHVFTVLVEGEPSDIIPRQLLSETVDGVERPLEPLSCDFRSTRREDRHAELVRLAAAILDVSFDSLMRRDRRRRTRIAAVAFCTVLAVVAGIAGFALWSNARIQEHYNEAVANHARLLVTEARQQLEGGDRLAAIELASAAVKQEGADRSMLPEAMHVLQQATGAYERVAGTQYMSALRMVARRSLGQRVLHLCSSPNGAYVGALGNHGLVRVWDAQTMEQLFETQLPNAKFTEVVVTDSGRMMVGCKERVSCWDLQSKECCWDIDVEEHTSGLYSAADHLVLSVDQAHVYALGKSLAASIDILSGDVATEVGYGLGPDAYPAYTGGASHMGDFIYDCADNVCVTSMVRSEAGSAKTYDSLCVLDFASGLCTILPTRYGAIRSIRLLDRTNAVVSFRDGASLNDSRSYRDEMVYRRQYSRHVVRKDLNTDETAWQADLSLWSPVWHESLQPVANPSASIAEEGDERQALAYCVADVCEVLDLDTGASLRHYEAPLPYVMSWPHADEGKVTGIYGCLIKGGTCANNLENGRSVSPDGQCVDAELGIRVGERTILVTADGSLYVYEGPRKDDAITALTQMSVSNAIPTQYGLLAVGVYGRDSATGQKAMRLCMVDCAGKRIRWERTVVCDGDDSLGVAAYDDACAELYVRSVKRSGAVDMTTVNLETGEAEEWKAASTTTKIEEGAVLVPGTGTSQNRFVTDRVYVLGGQRIAITDLHERKTSMVGLEVLGDEVGYSGETLFSPDHSLMLVSLEASDLANASLGRYALMTSACEVVKHLERPINHNVPLAWSDDGGMFAGASDDAVVVYDAKGNELFSTPLEGREVLAIHLMGDRLLVAYNERGSKVLMSYALNGGGPTLHTMLRVSESYAGSDLVSTVRWIPAARGHESGRDPGDLCMVFSNDNEAYLIDTATLTVCQDLSDCYGYDAGSDCFMVRTYDAEGTGQDPHVGLFGRYTIDDLVARGAEQVGTSKLSDIQRAEFGL